VDHLKANGILFRKSPSEPRKFQQAEPQAVIGFGGAFQGIEFAVNLIPMKIDSTVPTDDCMANMTSDRIKQLTRAVSHRCERTK
jgi:hypothetical protein